MKTKRVVRVDPSIVITDDGYHYEWAQGGEAVDVLPQHRKAALAVKGARLVDVEVIDEPVILPAFVTADPLPVTLVPPEPRIDPQIDVDALLIEPAVLPLADRGPDTTVAPAVEVTEPFEVRVTDLWSDADRALLGRST